MISHPKYTFNNKAYKYWLARELEQNVHCAGIKGMAIRNQKLYGITGKNGKSKV